MEERQANTPAANVDAVLGENGIAILRRTAILGLIGTIATALNIIDFNALRWQDASALPIIFTCIVTYGLLLRGHNRAAILTLIWGLYLALLGAAFVAVGVRSPALIFLPVLCIAAAWLLGLRAAVALGLTATCLLFFYVIAEHYGYKPPQEPRNALAYVLVYACAFAGVIIVARGSIGSFQNQLEHTRDLSVHLQRQVDELRQSEERFAALFRANPVPCSTNDRDGRIFDVNDAWVALTGVAANDAIGKTAHEVGIWNHAAERKAVYLEMERRGRVDGAAITLKTDGGAEKPFLLYIAPVSFDGQQRLVTSLLDQSDRYAAEATQLAVAHALEARVIARTAELSEALATLNETQTGLAQSEQLASLGAMVAGISHELNTPIGITVTVASALNNRIEGLRQAMAEDKLRRSALNEFLDDAQEMSALIQRSTERAAEQIRSFKQVAVDRTSERRRSFDVQDLVHDIVTSLQPSLPHTGLSLRIEQQVATGIVSDSLPGPIGQVLTNLIQNAVLHAFTGRPEGSVVIHAEVTGGGDESVVVLTVRDDGIGMSEHTQRHAFDPFFTTRMGQGGSGLGLSISHRLATQVLGGSLSLAAQPGQGCCFTFCWRQTLPESPA